MNKVSLQRRSVLGICAASAAVLALVAWPGGASAAQPYGAGGVMNACYKVKGKDKGALRLVKNARNCKRMRGWRRVSWSATGLPGAPGVAGGGAAVNGGSAPAGPQGETGAPGAPGEPGAPGLVGELEQSLLDTIQAQADQIAALTAQVNGLTTQLAGLTGLPGIVSGLTDDLSALQGTVSGLTGDLSGLEDIVGVVCGQLGLVTERSDALLGSLGGLSLNNALLLLGGLLNIPNLPGVPLGVFEGCAA